MCDIYNLNETALFYRLMPNKTLSDKSISGIKNHKDRITIGCISNADGSDKPKLVVILKFLKPRCFNHGYNPNSHVNYYSNKKAWMTCHIFCAWLLF